MATDRSAPELTGAALRRGCERLLPTRARLGRALGGHLPVRGNRVGLLGGSFNPAHEGHLHISREAMKRLRLDRLWWLVSPQNPLKPEAGMAALEERLAFARTLARHPRIDVTALEALFGTVATADTVASLKRYFPGVNFVWLMGADNLRQISQWSRWQEIFESLAIAVLDRPAYSQSALVAKAARRFAGERLPEERARKLAEKEPPAWAFLHVRLNPLSATALRQGRRE